MAGGDPKKPLDPQEAFRSGIKMVVGAVNNTLAGLEQVTEGVRKPTKATLHSMTTNASIAGKLTKDLYNKRNEFAPQLIGGSAVLGGGIMVLRRGRIAGVVGATAAAGVAYGVVYDQFSLESVPDIVFGKK